MRKIGIAFAACLLALSATACSNYNDSRGKGDAPVENAQGQRKGDDSPARVTNFPDDFANVATKCVAPGFRAFITTATHVAGKFIVLPDAACK